MAIGRLDQVGRPALPCDHPRETARPHHRCPARGCNAPARRSRRGRRRAGIPPPAPASDRAARPAGHAGRATASATSSALPALRASGWSMSVISAVVAQPAPFAVSTSARASASASAAVFRNAPLPDFTSSTSPSSPAASFFDRIEAVIRSTLSTAAASSRIAYSRRSAGARSALAATMAQPVCATQRRNVGSSGSVQKAGDRFQLVQRAARMAQAPAGYHRHIRPAGRQHRRKDQDTVSPIPPVECLSTTGPGRSQRITRPLSRIARVSATRPSAPMPRVRTAMAKAPACASLTAPSASPVAIRTASSDAQPTAVADPRDRRARVGRARGHGDSIPAMCATSNRPGSSSPTVVASVAPPVVASRTGTSARPNSASFWRHPPQGGTGCGLSAMTHDLDQFGLAGGDHRGDGAGLGAGAFGIGHVFHVAPAIDRPRGGPHGRPDLEPRIRAHRRLRALRARRRSGTWATFLHGRFRLPQCGGAAGQRCNGPWTGAGSGLTLNYCFDGG